MSRSQAKAEMHRSEAKGRFGEMHRRSLLRREPARSVPEGAARRCAEPVAMTRPQVASRSEVARGLRTSVCAKAIFQPSELDSRLCAPCRGAQHVVSSSCQRSKPRRAWGGFRTRLPFGARSNMSPHLQRAKPRFWATTFFFVMLPASISSFVCRHIKNL